MVCSISILRLSSTLFAFKAISQDGSFWIFLRKMSGLLVHNEVFMWGYIKSTVQKEQQGRKGMKFGAWKLALSISYTCPGPHC